MPRIGIVIEGVKDGYDERALTRFIEGAHTAQVDVIARPCGGASNLIQKFPRFLEEFRYKGDIERALVVRDADGKCFADLVANLRRMIAGRCPYPFQLDFHFIREELEAWFLADERALSQLVGRQVSPRHDPEKVLSAKEELKRVLSSGRRDYTPAVAESLAGSVDVEILKFRCPSFKRFWDLF